MNLVTDEEQLQSPISIVISYDGQVTVQGVEDEQEPSTSSLACQETLSDEAGNENSNDDDDELAELIRFNKFPSKKTTETFVNIDVNSDFLESYMEVLVKYRCKECSYICDDQKEFHQHCLKHLVKQNSNSSVVVYLCSNCSQAFCSSEETRLHMMRDHQLKLEDNSAPLVSDNVKTINVSIETSDSGKKCKNKKRKMKDGTQNVDTNLTYVCPQSGCNCKFSTEQFLKIHTECHVMGEIDTTETNYKKLFQCFQCFLLFNDWHSCASHLYKDHNIDCDLLKCPVCETYRTPLLLRLENHMRIHSEVRAFMCNYCGKAFKQASQLRNHRVTHVDKNSAAKPKWSTSKQCNFCYKMYSDSKSLKKHREEVHSKLRPFVCNVCGHASARKSMLTSHQRQHTGLKPFNCDMCNFTTADHNCLRRHIMRHTGVRPYKCPFCPYTAIQSGSYKNHIKLAHSNKGGGVYTCNVCPFNTISEDNHVRHVSDHLTGLIRVDSSNEKTTSDKSAECLQDKGLVQWSHQLKS